MALNILLQGNFPNHSDDDMHVDNHFVYDEITSTNTNINFNKSANYHAHGDNYIVSQESQCLNVAKDFDGNVSVKLLNGLRKFLKNPKATFSSQTQMNVLKSIFTKTDLIIIQPTGFGKSLCFFLPCVINPHLFNVVIVPTTCLLHNLMHRAKRGGITCREWKQSTGSYSVSENIVFLSAELAGTSGFREFLNINEKKIGGIFIDEVHLYKTWNNFRPKLEDIKLIREIEVPLILMSATVPVDMEKDLIQDFKLASTTKVYRGTTNRPELQLSVQICKFKTEVDANLIRLCKSSMENGRKLEAICKEIHDMLQKRQLKPWITSEVSSIEKKRKLEKWIGDDFHVMVATSALAYGVDVDVHCCVIHCGAPHSFIDYVQECGRAGRSGKAAFCRVLITDDQIYDLKKRGNDNMIKFLTDYSTCRRKHLSEYLDGKALTCSETMQKCDVCLGTVKRTENIIQQNLNAITQSTERTKQQRIEIMRKITKLLQHLHDKSQFCITSCATGQRIKHHSLTQCACADSFWKRRCYQCGSTTCKKNSTCRSIIFKGIKSGQLCFKCYLPESISDIKFHQSNQFGKNCKSKFIDKIWPLCIYLFHEKKHLLPYETSTMSLSQYLEWLFKGSNNINSTNAASVYTWWSETRSS